MSLPALSLTRRKMLTSLGAGVLTPVCAFALPPAHLSATFISAASQDDDLHFVKGFSVSDNSSELLFSHQLPARAHHVAVNETAGLYVVVARRPGAWLAVGNLHDNKAPRLLSLPENRRATGHGFFSADGTQFFSLETDVEALDEDDGRFVVWQVSAAGEFTRIKEFSTDGTGPHEGELMPDGETVAIANGGIRTSHDSEREMLNLDTMQPSLVYLNSNTGEVLQKVQLAPEIHQNSIRHLDVNASGQVVVAMQFEGDPFLDVPLVAMHRQGEPDFTIPEIDFNEQIQLKQYCGSVCFDESGRYAAVSAPRGNRITFWDTEEKRFMNSVRSRDGCGVCALDSGFVFTAGTGRISFLDLDTQQTTLMDMDTDARIFWDNHLSRA